MDYNELILWMLKSNYHNFSAAGYSEGKKNTWQNWNSGFVMSFSNKMLFMSQL